MGDNGAGATNILLIERTRFGSSAGKKDNNITSLYYGIKIRQVSNFACYGVRIGYFPRVFKK